MILFFEAFSVFLMGLTLLGDPSPPQRDIKKMSLQVLIILGLGVLSWVLVALVGLTAWMVLTLGVVVWPRRWLIL